MRIQAANHLPASVSAQAPRRAAGGFVVAGADNARAPAASAAPRAVAGIDALLALQAVEDAGERRRRAVRRGRSALDALEEIKLGLLAGGLDESLLGRLRAASADLREASGDPRLDAVLAEIELRAAVEIAKLSRR